MKSNITRDELTQAIREVYWTKQSPQHSKGSVEDTVELVIPPVAKAARLLRFMCQLEERLSESDSDDCAGIMHTIGSWNRGSVIAVSLGDNPLENFLEILANMADVEKVEIGSLAGNVFPSYPDIFGTLLRPSLSYSKRVCVILKETSIVEQ